MEKRSFRLGIKTAVFTHSFAIIDFLNVQIYWKKDNKNYISMLNKFFLGFKNSTIFFHSEFLIEFLKRLSYFCFHNIFNLGNFLFLNSICNIDFITRFFFFRSFNFIKTLKWFGNSLIRCKYKKLTAIFVLNYKSHIFLSTETNKILVPIFSFTKTDFHLSKNFYPLFFNNNLKEISFLFFSYLSNIFLYSFILKYISKLTTEK